MRSPFLICLILIACLNPASADRWRFHMKDGSVVVGEMQGFANGVYSVSSPMLGQVRIKEANLQGMVRMQPRRQATKRGSTSPYPTSPQASTRTQGSASTNSLLDVVPESIRNKLLTDPNSMRSIYRLQGHPGVRQILSNPQAMNAIRRGDFNSLTRDPGVQRLLQDPNVQQIVSRIAR